MALIICKECGFKISDKAPACVHCGAPVPASSAAPAAPKKKAPPKALWLLLIVGAGLFFGWVNGLDKEFENIMAPPAPPKPPAMAPVSPVISVSAIQLFKDYQANKVAADRSYKGKSLLVKGVVNSINKNTTEAPCLSILAGDSSKKVRAQFAKSELPKLSALKRGQQITVACTGGSMPAGSPALKGCVIAGPRISQ